MNQPDHHQIHPQPHDLTALAYGMLEEPERQSVLEHVHLCDACRQVYDSYLEEQALVRDVLFRDARSGPAEARALERTLVALQAADLQEPAPKGMARLYRLVTWKLVAQVAAALVLALGLLLVLKPRPDIDSGSVNILAENQAPTTVLQGELQVPVQGQWKRANAVPMNEWVLSGPESALTLAFEDGSQAEIAPSAVFRVVNQDGGDRAALIVLHGGGKFTAGKGGRIPALRATEGEFVMLPGAVVEFDAQFDDSAAWQPDAGAVRAWMDPRKLNVHVSRGQGVFLPDRPGVLPGVLAQGERLEFRPRDVRLMQANDATFELNFELYAEGEPKAFQVRMLALEQRIAGLEQGPGKLDENLWRKLEESMRSARGGEQRTAIFVRAMATPEDPSTDARVVEVIGAQGALARLSQDKQGQWSFKVSRKSAGVAESSYSDEDPEVLRRALPADQQALFEEAMAAMKQHGKLPK
ncbi:MAG: hypothetical protein IPP14_04865 [Planctomycetes bacterium]|nr:hypothetical protein [Planctomycetota bacterium]